MTKTNKQITVFVTATLAGVLVIGAIAFVSPFLGLTAIKCALGAYLINTDQV